MQGRGQSGCGGEPGKTGTKIGIAAKKINRDSQKELERTPRDLGSRESEGGHTSAGKQVGARRKEILPRPTP